MGRSGELTMRMLLYFVFFATLSHSLPTLPYLRIPTLPNFSKGVQNALAQPPSLTLFAMSYNIHFLHTVLMKRHLKQNFIK